MKTTKKLCSVILVVCIMLSLVFVSASAESTTEPPANEPLYVEKFISQFQLSDEYTQYYRELYYHYDAEQNMDWVLVSCQDLPMPWMVRPYAVIEDLFISTTYYLPFGLMYSVFDVKKDKFYYDLYNAYEGGELEGIYDVLRELNIGTLIGDIDRDGKYSVLDATYIQRCLVGLSEWPADDELNNKYNGGTGDRPLSSKCEISFLSDFDRDGERTVMDATAIQLKLVK